MADVYFLVVDWANDYKNTPDFATKELRDQWFLDRSAAAASNQNVSYFRMYDTFRVAMPYNQISTYNYLFFKQDGKRWFYFINRVTYSNPNLQLLDVELDVLVTYMFDYTIPETFIERAHMPRVRGVEGEPQNYKFDYSVCMEPENLDAGELYNQISQKNIYRKESENGIAWAWIITGKRTLDFKYPYKNDTGGTMVQRPMIRWGIYEPLIAYCVPFKIGEDITNSTQFYAIGQGGTKRTLWKVVEMVEEMAANTEFANSIYSFFVAPFCPWAQLEEGSNNTFILNFDMATDGDLQPTQQEGLHYVIVPRYIGETLTNLCNVADFIGEGLYNPNSKISVSNWNSKTWDKADEPKLYTAPYTTVSLEYQRGNRIEMNIAYIKPTTGIGYCVAGGAVPKDSFYLIDYLNSAGEFILNYEYMIPNNTLAEMPVIQDNYLTYLQQQKATMLAGLATNIGQNVAMAAIAGNAKGIPGAVVGTVGSIANALAKEKELQKKPIEARKSGNNTPFELSINGFMPYISVDQITAEKFDKIARFFTMFGYSVNRAFLPNVRSRYYFNFIKTNGSHITGLIPEEHKRVINNAFDNGITFWHLDREGVEMFKYFEKNNYEVF